MAAAGEVDIAPDEHAQARRAEPYVQAVAQGHHHRAPDGRRPQQIGREHRAQARQQQQRPPLAVVAKQGGQNDGVGGPDRREVTGLTTEHAADEDEQERNRAHQRSLDGECGGGPASLSRHSILGAPPTPIPASLDHRSSMSAAMPRLGYQAGRRAAANGPA